MQNLRGLPRKTFQVLRDLGYPSGPLFGGRVRAKRVYRLPIVPRGVPGPGGPELSSVILGKVYSAVPEGKAENAQLSPGEEISVGILASSEDDGLTLFPQTLGPLPR